MLWRGKVKAILVKRWKLVQSEVSHVHRLCILDDSAAATPRFSLNSVKLSDTAIFVFAMDDY